MSDSEIFVSVGRRKTSVARVRLGKGTGKILVNEKPVAEYCYTDQLRMIATRPLACTGLQDSVDAQISVKGGGPGSSPALSARVFRRSAPARRHRPRP